MEEAQAIETTEKSRRPATEIGQPSRGAMARDVTDLRQRSVFRYRVR